MALGDPYITRAQMKVFSKVPADNASLDSLLDDVIGAASKEVNKHTHRQFNKADIASARVYKPLSRNIVYTDDFWTTEGLVVAVDSNGSRSYTTIMSPSDYEVYPLNGIVDGEPGWPFWKIKLRDFGSFSTGYASVQVTAKWGWEAVPDLVRQATYLLANEGFAAKGAPLGVAGYGNFGEIRVRPNSLASNKLCGLIRDPLQARGA